jgi:acyl carrier protein
MLPSIYIPLEALPKTPSGKVDRRALPAPKASTAGRNARESLRPQTETERAVAGIWAEVLRITPPDSISINDDFFRDAGGHSLLATQFVTRVRDRLKVSFPLRAIFEQPTIRGIAGIIDAARAVSDPNPAALDEMVGRAAGTTAIPRLARDRYRITFATNGDIEAAPE